MSNYMIAIDADGQPYLAHHGIKGQKWGVRRYQNPDGTWTNAGKKRYNVEGAPNTTKTLHKIERENARLINKRANAMVKANKAYQKGDDKAYEKHIAKAKSYDESINAGKRATDKIIADKTNSGYSVNQTAKTRYTHTGRVIAASLLLTPVAGAAIFGVDVYRANKYGGEAGGFVKGSRYTTERKY